MNDQSRAGNSYTKKILYHFQVVNFYFKCVKYAFFKTYFAWLGWISFAVLLLTLAAKFFVDHLPGYLFFLQGIEIIYASGTLALFVFLIRLIYAPFHFYRTERDKRKQLDEERSPRLDITISDPDGSDQCRTVTDETMGGFRFPHPTLQYKSAVCLTVSNNSHVRVGPCVAELISAKKKMENGSFEIINFIESVTLSWSAENTESALQSTIEANRSRRVWIASSDYNGNLWLVREKDNLLSDQQMIFGGAGVYHATIQISDGFSLPTIATLEITSLASASGHHMSPGKVSLKFI